MESSLSTMKRVKREQAPSTAKGRRRESPSSITLRQDLHLGRFKNDRQNGKAYEYYPSGAIHKEAQFADDLRHGPEKSYHENGQLASLYHFKQGKLEGTGAELERRMGPWYSKENIARGCATASSTNTSTTASRALCSSMLTISWSSEKPAHNLRRSNELLEVRSGA